MNDIINTAPVIFIFFNRPDCTQLVFEKIKLAKPTQLFLISDGPRNNNKEDKILCEKSRNIVKNIDWNCDVKHNYSQFNLGCKNRVSSGITWAFKHTTEAIILEDDCLPDMSFFHFCTELLNMYKNNDHIFQINGSCFLNISTIKESYFLSKYNHTWGWATWKRAWDKFELENDSFEHDFKSFSFSSTIEKDYWYEIFLKYFSGKIDTWDYPWMFSMWKNRGLSIYPTKNMVKNIGFRHDATHTKSKNKLETMPLQKISELSHPTLLVHNQQLDAKNFEYVFLDDEIHSKPKNLQQDTCTAKNFLEIGKKALSDNNYTKALRFFSQIKSLKYKQKNIDYFRALSFLGIHDIASAIEALKEELRHFPHNRTARLLLTKLYKTIDKPKVINTEIESIIYTIRNYTMLGRERLYSLYFLSKKICELDIPGNFVECGVAAGGSSALLAYVIKKYSKRSRLLYSFDTFEGMPEPTANDTHHNIAANDTGWGFGTCSANEQSLLKICNKLNAKEIVVPIKGLFKNTLPQNRKVIGDIALLHMDGDWYESTQDILNNFYDQVSLQGYIQVDDYGHWEGCKKALHEFEHKIKAKFLIHNIDNTGVWFQKMSISTDISCQRHQLLNLGCGKRTHPSWVNLDFTSDRPEIIAHDLTLGIPFKDESFDCTYSSHLLEHFSKNEASFFLADSFRVLKPNGIIRIVVPDLEVIARLYLMLLEKSLKGDTEAQKRYDWIILELFDQMVRNQSGGEMLNYWRQNPMPAEDFVFERLGSEIQNTVLKNRIQSKLNDITFQPITRSIEPHEITKFRMSGEIHQWMYDRYSLGKLLQQAGFEEIKVCRANESLIPDFNSYLLDIEADGSVRKPDSLFMEARKPKLQKTQIQNKKLIRTALPEIVQFCMQDFGGAGTAALRLHEELIRQSTNSYLYVQNMAKWRDHSFLLTKDPQAIQNQKFISPEWNVFQVYNKAALSKYTNRPTGVEMFSIPWAATKLKDIPKVTNANIVNLHWISGTLCIADNLDFLKGKKIVWTLHDMNAFTGGCHYAAGCQNYNKQCGCCPQLASNHDDDLSRKIWQQKMAAYSELDITVVTLCQWMADCVKSSSLLSKFPVRIIPNGVPTDIFKPLPKTQIRESLKVPQDSFVILFGADSIDNIRKGFRYLLQALHVLQIEFKQTNFILAIFGNSANIETQHLGYKTIYFDYIENESELAMIYSMADVTVIPSLEDNLPNIVLESLACGTPVVGFNVGGIQDMVKHHVNGYLASSGDATSLAEGILWTKNHSQNRKTLRLKCRETVLSKFNLYSQAKTYKSLYNDIITP